MCDGEMDKRRIRNQVCGIEGFADLPGDIVKQFQGGKIYFFLVKP